MTKRKSGDPKILVFDIETTANLGFVWGKYEQNVIEYMREWSLLGLAYQWIGDKRPQSMMLCDVDGYKKGSLDDRKVVEFAWNLLNEADAVIAHNGDRFDIRKLNARFLYYGLTPPSSYKSIDTLKIARKYFALNSNKLDDIGNYLSLGRKLKHDGFEMWLGCMAGDEKYWSIMRKYNIQDVKLLTDVYMKLRPWMENHPNLNIITGENNCPKCQSKNLQRRGYALTTTGRKSRFQCQDCGGWGSGSAETITNIR